MVVLDKETPLTEGTEVVVTPVVAATGSPAAILSATEATPRVPAEWVDELEQLIAQGRRPPARLDLFADEQDSQETPKCRRPS
jgi:hypothetical protein